MTTDIVELIKGFLFAPVETFHKVKDADIVAFVETYTTLTGFPFKFRAYVRETCVLQFVNVFHGSLMTSEDILYINRHSTMTQILTNIDRRLSKYYKNQGRVELSQEIKSLLNINHNGNNQDQ